MRYGDLVRLICAYFGGLGYRVRRIKDNEGNRYFQVCKQLDDSYTIGVFSETYSGKGLVWVRDNYVGILDDAHSKFYKQLINREYVK